MAKAISSNQPLAAQPKESVVPDFMASSQGVILPRLPASHPFIYYVHPNSWHIQGGKLIPILSKVPLVPGVENTRMVGGRWNIAGLEAKKSNYGWIRVPYNLAPDKNSYLKSVTCADSRTNATYQSFISVFEKAFPGASSTKFDLNGYVDWCETLIHAILPPASPVILDELLAKAIRKNKDSDAEIIRRAMAAAEESESQSTVPSFE